jgi:hypothetical protein
MYTKYAKLVRFAVGVVVGSTALTAWQSRAKAEIDTASAPVVVSTFSSAPTPPSGESALKHVRGSRIYAQRRSRNSSGADAVRHIIAMLALSSATAEAGFITIDQAGGDERHQPAAAGRSAAWAAPH